MTAPQRTPPPARRPSQIEKLAFGGRKFHIGFGFAPAHASATPRVVEIWIDGPKAGSHEQQALHDAAAMVSMALQHDIPATTLASMAADDHDGNPASVLGAVLRRATIIDDNLTTGQNPLENNQCR